MRTVEEIKFMLLAMPQESRYYIKNKLRSMNVKKNGWYLVQRIVLDQLNSHLHIYIKIDSTVIV